MNLDHQVDIREVETSSSNISRHNDVGYTVLEIIKGLDPVCLIDITMKLSDIAYDLIVLCQVFSFVLRLGKHYTSASVLGVLVDQSAD